MWFLFANSNPKVSTTTLEPAHPERDPLRRSTTAARAARRLGRGAGRGRRAVDVPRRAAGGAPGSSTNLAKAKAELAASGIRTRRSKLEFPSDFTSNGLSFGVVAQKIKSDLDKVGIKVELAGAPIATSLANYRAGTEELGLWYWGPDYPDPNDYLVFLPGPARRPARRLGRRLATRRSRRWASKAGSTVRPGRTRRSSSRRSATQLNQRGPFYPLFQPGQVVASSKNLTRVDLQRAVTGSTSAAVGSR